MFRTILTFQFMLDPPWIRSWSVWGPLRQADEERGQEGQVSLVCWGREERGHSGLSAADHLTKTSLWWREGTWAKSASSAEWRARCPQQGDPSLVGSKWSGWGLRQAWCAQQKDLLSCSLREAAQAEVAVLPQRGHVSHAIHCGHKSSASKSVPPPTSCPGQETV